MFHTSKFILTLLTRIEDARSLKEFGRSQLSLLLTVNRSSVAVVQVGSVHQGFFGYPNLNQSEFGQTT